jgi:hypothetical protein
MQEALVPSTTSPKRDREREGRKEGREGRKDSKSLLQPTRSYTTCLLLVSLLIRHRFRSGCLGSNPSFC